MEGRGKKNSKRRRKNEIVRKGKAKTNMIKKGSRGGEGGGENSQKRREKRAVQTRGRKRKK